MIRRLAVSAVVLLLALLAGSCRSSSDPAVVQEKFGVRMAKMNLWREAMFRFQRAVELNPEDAMALNNLAVAYEANGDFDAAAKAYREALRLDRSNEYIQKNYSRFVEFTTRDRRRQQQQQRMAARSSAASADDEAPAAAPPPSAPAETPEADAVPPSATPPAGEGAPTSAAPAAIPPPDPPPAKPPPPQPSEPPAPLGGLA